MRNVVPPVIVIALALLAWQVIVAVTGLPAFILPRPAQVIGAMVRTSDTLVPAVLATLSRTAVGLGIAVILAIGVAAVMDLVPLIRRALYPLIVASQTVQILAIAPLLVIWFGFGAAPTIIVVVLFTFFPMAIATLDGLAATDNDYIALLRSMGARRHQIWREVRLPAALPSFFSGLRLSVTYSVVAATIGEWVGASEGLGLYMLRSKNALKTDQVFAAVLITTILSIALFALVFLIERVSLPWARASRETDSWEESGIY